GALALREPLARAEPVEDDAEVEVAVALRYAEEAAARRRQRPRITRPRGLAHDGDGAAGVAVREQPERRRERPHPVEHDAERLAAFEPGLAPGPGVADGEPRVVRPRRPRADEHGVLLGAPAVDERAALLGGDPAAVAGGRRHLPVEGLSPLERDERAARRNVAEERLVEPPRLAREDADGHVHARRAEAPEAAAGDLGERVLVRHDDARDAPLQHEVGARRRLAVVAAR